MAVGGLGALVFLGGTAAAIIGVLLWRLGLAVHESVMSAAAAEMIPASRRAGAYGLFMAALALIVVAARLMWR
jgi:hypothetical protein